MRLSLGDNTGFVLRDPLPIAVGQSPAEQAIYAAQGKCADDFKASVLSFANGDQTKASQVMASILGDPSKVNTLNQACEVPPYKFPYFVGFNSSTGDASSSAVCKGLGIGPCLGPLDIGTWALIGGGLLLIFMVSK